MYMAAAGAFVYFCKDVEQNSHIYSADVDQYSFHRRLSILVVEENLQRGTTDFGYEDRHFVSRISSLAASFEIQN